MKYKYNGQWYDLSCSLNVSNLLIGEIIEYAGESIPGGYLVCDGSAVSRTEYSELFDVIGTIYGSGDGSTTFNLPDLRGRVVTGLNTTNSNFNVLGKTGGEETVTLTIENIPSHAHGTAVTDSSMGASAGNASMITGYQKTDGYPTGATGGGQAHNNLQPYITINYLIRAKKTKNVLTTASTVVDSLEGNSTVDAPSVRAVNKALLDKYSTEEVKTNKVWIDGKPIYRKVIDIGNLPNATKKEVAAGISNLKYVTRLYGVATTGAYTITIPDTYPNNALYDTRLSYDNSTGKIVLFSESDRSAYSGYVIIEYTKTTDTVS